MGDRVFFAVSWTPAAALVGFMAYVSSFEGWGQWAAAPLLLLPVFLSLLVSSLGGLRVAIARRNGRPTGALSAATALSAVPLVWMAYRLMVSR